MLTIVIPTRNHPAFMIRLLSYYHDQNLKNRLVIADSSDPDQASEIKRAIGSLGESLNIEYRQYKSEVGVANKLSDSLRYVETRYTVFGADDDLFIPSGLTRAAQFLQSNSDFSVVHGEALAFRSNSDAACGPITELGRYNQRTIDHDSGAERIVDHFAPYSTTWYSMRRTEESLENMHKMVDLELDPFSFDELFLSSVSIIQGKAKRLGGLYMARQVHSDAREYCPNVFDWVTNPSWPGKYQRFRDSLAEQLAQQDEIDIDVARDVVKEAFWTYLASSLARKWAGRYTKNRPGLRSGARELARQASVLRRAYNMGHSLLPKEANEMTLPTLLRRSSPYHDDFMPIYQAITTPSNLLERVAVES